jgi:serine phosphatase RsbU (regulator of sigma subunit)
MMEPILFIVLGTFVGYFLGTWHRTWRKRNIQRLTRVNKLYRDLPEYLRLSFRQKETGSLPFSPLLKQWAETFSCTSAALYLFTDFSEQLLTLKGSWVEPSWVKSEHELSFPPNLDGSFLKDFFSLPSMVTENLPIKELQTNRPQNQKGQKWILVPLVDKYRNIGILMLSTGNKKVSKNSVEFRYLLESAYTFCKGLVLLEEFSRNVELELERRREEFCEEVQIRMNRTKLSEHKNVSVHSFIKPKLGINSDYIDYLQVSESEFLVAHGEITGKGFNAVLTLTVIKTIIHAIVPSLKHPAHLLNRLNRVFRKSLTGDFFASLTILLFDVKKKELLVGKAGNGGVVRFSFSGSKNMDTIDGGPPLGTHKDYSYTETPFAIQSGDIWVLYSDGVSEITNEQSKVYKTERLFQLVQANKFLSSKDILERIKDDMWEFKGKSPLKDDISVMVMKFL